MSNLKRYTMRKLLPLIGLLLGCAIAQAEPPYNVSVDFGPPLTGGTPAGYNLYIDDCADSGPVGSPFGSVTSGQTFSDALTSDGSYEVCVRPFNASGELADPGPVAVLDVNQIPVPGPVENLDITVECKDGSGTVVDCSAAGVNVTVTIS